MDADESSSTSTISSDVSEPDSEVRQTIQGARGRGVDGRRRGRGRGGVSPAELQRTGSVRVRGFRGRGRGRGGRGREERPSQSDRERVQERFRQRSEKLETVVRRMQAKKLRDLVLELVKREPGMVFDLVDDGWSPPSQPPPQPPQPSGDSVPSWCRCENCVQMPTELERKCCGCKPEHCVSQRDQMERICLGPEVLAVGQAYYRDMLGRRNQRVEEYSKTMRHSAYRNFILWRNGRLGAGVRRVIPSCCVRRIRNKFPSATGTYTGFIPSKFI